PVSWGGGAKWSRRSRRRCDWRQERCPHSILDRDHRRRDRLRSQADCRLYSNSPRRHRSRLAGPVAEEPLRESRAIGSSPSRKRRQVEYITAVPAGFNFTTKASIAPPRVGCAGFVVGKFADSVRLNPAQGVVRLSLRWDLLLQTPYLAAGAGGHLALHARRLVGLAQFSGRLLAERDWRLDG